MPIYFIQAGEGGPIKIGYSANPAARLVKVQADNPAECVLLGQVLGEKADEARLHNMLARHRLRGEWFAPSPAVLSMVPKETRVQPATRRSIERCPGADAARASIKAAKRSLAVTPKLTGLQGSLRSADGKVNYWSELLRADAARGGQNSAFYSGHLETSVKKRREAYDRLRDFARHARSSLFVRPPRQTTEAA